MTGMNISVGSNSGWVQWAAPGAQPPPFTTIYQAPPFAPPFSEPEDMLDYARRVLEKPDHEYNPPEGGRYCQDCHAGCIHMDDPAAHLYIIREWGLG